MEARRRSRWNLRLQAVILRCLEQIGLWLGSWSRPVPPQPSFVRRIPVQSLDGGTGTSTMGLAFYVGESYARDILQGKRHPVVLNLHGGGFTIGTAKDDARWAACVTAETGAIFVSVDYRLAPEHPFPTGLDDCVAALLHLTSHAEEYGINARQIALSGFSAGGNLAFTIPLRLQARGNESPNFNERETPVASSDRSDDALRHQNIPRIVSIIAWYPSLDQRLTRAQRRATCSRPEKTLPPILTNLFDESWLPDPGSKSSPFASPSAAPDEMLQQALPATAKIALYLCEWDMLRQEGLDFCERLRGLGKAVQCTVIGDVQHGFDKSPWPFGVDPRVTRFYGEACAVLREAFDQ